MNSLEQLRGLGYRVDASQPPASAASAAVYYVEGPGVALYVRDDDEAALQSLLDSHEDRVAQLAADQG